LFDDLENTIITQPTLPFLIIGLDSSSEFISFKIVKQL